MALVGDFTHYYATTGSVENITTVTYPSSLSIDDPNYDKRGTTEELRDFNTESHQTFTSSYLSISELVNYTTLNEEGNNSSKLFIKYQVFPSKEFKYASSSLVDNMGVLHTGELIGLDYTFNPSGSNDFDYAYSYLKTLKGFENLTTD